MTVLRFATARALFDSFPELWKKIRTQPTEQPPIDFLKGLSSANKLTDAVTFCAFLLPRREVVWWACRCFRVLAGEVAAREPGLLAAEAWVQDPGDQHRRAALDIGTNEDSSNPATWLALAAGWSGGFQAFSPNRQVPVPQHLTPRAARIAVLTSLQKLRMPARQDRLRDCIADGVKLAEGGL